MYRAMSDVVPIAQEDAYVALLASKAGITPQVNDHFVMLRRPSNICHHLQMFFIYEVLPHEHLEIFKSIRKAQRRTECLQAEVVHGGNNRQQIKTDL